MSEALFQVGSSFQGEGQSGGLELGRLESVYEELFAEVIEDGVITAEERARLDKMADSLGLDRVRLRKLEVALEAAYQARHRIAVRDISAEAPPRSISPLEPATDMRTQALERKIQRLEARVLELEKELEDARSHLAVDVDFSDVASAGASREDETLEALERRLRHDPTDTEVLRRLAEAAARNGDKDLQFRTASVLAFLGSATAEEKKLVLEHRPEGLIAPKAAVSRDAWGKLLFHPEEEPLVGEIFAVVTGAVLMGRLSSLRRDKSLPKLDAAKKHDPQTSTVQAVRAFAWGAQVLGMPIPALYVDPDADGLTEMVPAIPPAVRIGRKALSGRSALELAFLCGRHLAAHRAEHFIRMLLSDVRNLEEVFLAALSIGNPGLPMHPQTKALVVPIAQAIEPVLEPAHVDRLRGCFLRFVEDGGRTNLSRWADAVEKTWCRAGLLLASDLGAAKAVLSLEDPAHAEEKMNDLLVFWLSERHGKLRKQLGIGVA